MSRFHLIPLVLTALLCARPLPLPAAEAPVLQVIATRQEFDEFIPWQKKQPVERTGYGVVVGTGTVLTTENVVRHQSLVELVAPRSGKRIPARVLLADEQVDLALLSVAPGDLADVPAPCRLAALEKPTGSLRVVQFDATRELQAGSATLLRVQVDGLPSAGYSSLLIDVLTDLSVNGEGAPVLDADGALNGVVVSYAAASRTARAIPAPVIRQFLDDAAQPPYEGFASAGFLWHPLVDPTRRSWQGVDKEPGGVLVVSCVSGWGAEGVLKPNDVILNWDGRAVDDLGYYADPQLGRLLFPYLIKGRRHPGDRVPVDLVRNGNRMQVELELRRATEDAMLIPDNTTGRRDPYIVEAGLLLREATGRYLQAYGPDWQRQIDSALVHLYLTRKLTPARPGQRVVLLASVLPHPINIGYQHFFGRIVTHVNGQAIDNLRDVFRIRDTDGHITRLTIKDVGTDVVLDPATIDAANAELARLYAIPALRWPAEPGVETTR
jgi:S1-C subfamily serine protease